MSRIKVYYNSACPVCNAGIEGQKRRMEGCPTGVEWIDIHSRADAVKEIGAEREFVRERLHVVDDDGALKVGADALETLWLHTPGEEWLARILRLPVVRTVARWVYNGFAAGLYAWNRARGRWQVETEYLFSYGTLQTEAVQLGNFGRMLAGEPDALVAHVLTLIPARTQPPAHAGATHHRNARYTGIVSDVVEGMRFAVTREELERADAYERGADYRRVPVRLRSGIDAWVYVSMHDLRERAAGME